MKIRQLYNLLKVCEIYSSSRYKKLYELFVTYSYKHVIYHGR